MPRPVRSIARDDLFQLFPDLPRPRLRPANTQRAHVLDLVAKARDRVAENARRQLEVTRRVRAIIAARQHVIPGRRRSTIS